MLLTWNFKIPSSMYSVSTVALKVARIGMERTVAAWKYHTIPGKYPNN